MRRVLVKSKRMPEDSILGVVFDVESTGALGFGSKRRKRLNDEIVPISLNCTLQGS